MVPLIESLPTLFWFLSFLFHFLSAVDTIKSFADEHGSLVAEAELLRRELAAYRGEQGTAQEHEEVDAAQAEAAYQAHQDASMYATQQPEAEAGAEAEEPYNQ